MTPGVKHVWSLSARAPSKGLVSTISGSRRYEAVAGDGKWININTFVAELYSMQKRFSEAASRPLLDINLFKGT